MLKLPCPTVLNCLCNVIQLLTFVPFFPLMCISAKGDLVDAVVPYMGESISDGTLAKLLKSMFFVIVSTIFF